MNILAGMKVTDEAGYQAVVVKPGDTTGVLSLSSGEMREWHLSSFKVDDKQDIASVFVVNNQQLKVSTIMWGVLLATCSPRSSVPLPSASPWQHSWLRQLVLLPKPPTRPAMPRLNKRCRHSWGEPFTAARAILIIPTG
jgi:hypothetical protein